MLTENFALSNVSATRSSAPSSGLAMAKSACLKYALSASKTKRSADTTGTPPAPSTKVLSEGVTAAS